MNTARAFAIAAGTLLEVAGVVLLVPPAYFLIQYWTNPDNPLRHEYMIGFGLAILPPTVALGLAALLAILCRRVLSRTTLLCMVVPGIIVGLVATLFLFVPMTFALFARKI